MWITRKGGASGRATARIVALLATLVATSFAVSGVAIAAPSAPRGGDAVYQVEISANMPGPQGGGSWFWLELDRDGGGIYAGSDCAHGGGASSARGALTWEQQGDQLVIHAYEPILVPAAYGHYVKIFAEVFPTLTAVLTSVGADLSNGSVQVQVAP